MLKLPRIFTYILTICILNVSGSAYAFRDADSKTQRAAGELIDSGLFDAFIYRHGDNYFRPEGGVTRQDLLLALHEYYGLIERLLEQNEQIRARLQETERRGLSSSDIDMIMREFQRNLEPMLSSSPTIEKLETKAPGRREPDKVADISEEIERAYRTKLREIEKKVSEVVEEKALEGIETEITKLSDRINRLDEVVSRVDTYERETFDPEMTTAEAFTFPFWARVSIGFSVLSLFFMSR